MKLNPVLGIEGKDFGQAYSKFIDIVDRISDVAMNSYRYATIASDIDFKYLNPKYFKLDKFGNVINTWCMLYIGEPKLLSAFNPSNSGNRNGVPFNFTSRGNIDDFHSIVLYGISIDISASPIVIETRVKGTQGPVYQTFGSTNYDINLTFLESGPTFWQQNSKDITQLVGILNSGLQITILNPQLEIIYGINKVICTGYNIGQDPRFYSHNNISITFKSDNVNQDILVPKKTT